jgi:glycosyltransferase involved in cell wall biosynthesis
VTVSSPVLCMPTPAAGARQVRLSIILPAMDETWSLRETVQRIENSNQADVLEYLIVICRHTTEQCRSVAEQLVATYSGRVQILEQRLPYLGGAVRDAFEAARGSHVVMMGADLETDPATIPLMVAQAQLHPSAIITATRWKGGFRFNGYDLIKLALNRIFQQFFTVLYHVPLTDLTFAYRVIPTELARSIEWEELKHPFLFETIVKPLRLGVAVIEVPSFWQKRGEGVTHNSFFTNFLYFRTGLKTRFRSPKKLLRNSQ